MYGNSGVRKLRCTVIPIFKNFKNCFRVHTTRIPESKAHPHPPIPRAPDFPQPSQTRRRHQYPTQHGVSVRFGPIDHGHMATGPPGTNDPGVSVRYVQIGPGLRISHGSGPVARKHGLGVSLRFCTRVGVSVRSVQNARFSQIPGFWDLEFPYVLKNGSRVSVRFERFGPLIQSFPTL